MKQGVTLNDLSQLLNVTDRHLSLYIKNTYGLTFNRWINTLRIDYAKQLVRQNHTLLIDEAADLSGFSDKSNFSKTFKDITGISFQNFKKSLQ